MLILNFNNRSILIANGLVIYSIIRVSNLKFVGAGGALGSGTASEFSKCKALLSLIDINQERLDNLVETLKKSGYSEERVWNFVVSHKKD